MEFYNKPPIPTLPARSKFDGSFYCEKHVSLVYGECDECLAEPEKAHCEKCGIVSFEKDLEWDKEHKRRLCYYCRVSIGFSEMLNRKKKVDNNVKK